MKPGFLVVFFFLFSFQICPGQQLKFEDIGEEDYTKRNALLIGRTKDAYYTLVYPKKFYSTDLNDNFMKAFSLGSGALLIKKYSLTDHKLLLEHSSFPFRIWDGRVNEKGEYEAVCLGNKLVLFCNRFDAEKKSNGLYLHELDEENNALGPELKLMDEMKNVSDKKSGHFKVISSDDGTKVALFHQMPEKDKKYKHLTFSVKVFDSGLNMISEKDFQFPYVNNEEVFKDIKLFGNKLYLLASGIKEERKKDSVTTQMKVFCYDIENRKSSVLDLNTGMPYVFDMKLTQMPLGDVLVTGFTSKKQPSEKDRVLDGFFCYEIDKTDQSIKVQYLQNVEDKLKEKDDYYIGNIMFAEDNTVFLVVEQRKKSRTSGAAFYGGTPQPSPYGGTPQQSPSGKIDGTIKGNIVVFGLRMDEKKFWVKKIEKEQKTARMRSNEGYSTQNDDPTNFESYIAITDGNILGVFVTVKNENLKLDISPSAQEISFENFYSKKIVEDYREALSVIVTFDSKGNMHANYVFDEANKSSLVRISNSYSLEKGSLILSVKKGDKEKLCRVSLN